MRFLPFLFFVWFPFSGVGSQGQLLTEADCYRKFVGAEVLLEMGEPVRARRELREYLGASKCRQITAEYAYVSVRVDALLDRLMGVVYEHG